MCCEKRWKEIDRSKNQQIVLALFFTWLQSTQIDPLSRTTKLG